MLYYSVQKLDRRHSGHEWFSHYIHYDYVQVPRGYTLTDRENNFISHRSWLWENYGPAVELKLYDSALHRPDHMSFVSKDWAWQTEHNLMRLYIKEHILTHFLLSHAD